MHVHTIHTVLKPEWPYWRDCSVHNTITYSIHCTMSTLYNVHTFYKLSISPRSTLLWLQTFLSNSVCSSHSSHISSFSRAGGVGMRLLTKVKDLWEKADAGSQLNRGGNFPWGSGGWVAPFQSGCSSHISTLDHYHICQPPPPLTASKNSIFLFSNNLLPFPKLPVTRELLLLLSNKSPFASYFPFSR